MSDDERRPVAADGDQLRRLLRDDGLDVGRLDLLPRLPDGSEVWGLPSTGTDWFGLWQRLRTLVTRTGRWPVATCTWGYDEDHLNREPAGATSGTLPPPARLMREAAEAAQVRPHAHPLRRARVPGRRARGAGAGAVVPALGARRGRAGADGR